LTEDMSKSTLAAMGRSQILASLAASLLAVALARSLPAQVAPPVRVVQDPTIPDIAMAGWDNGPVVRINPLVASRYPLPLLRFFLAHELAHHALHHATPAGLAIVNARPWISPAIELEADCAAAAALRNTTSPQAFAQFAQGQPSDGMHYPGPIRARRVLQCAAHPPLRYARRQPAYDLALNFTPIAMPPSPSEGPQSGDDASQCEDLCEASETSCVAAAADRVRQVVARCYSAGCPCAGTISSAACRSCSRCLEAAAVSSESLRAREMGSCTSSATTCRNGCQTTSDASLPTLSRPSPTASGTAPSFCGNLRLLITAAATGARNYRGSVPHVVREGQSTFTTWDSTLTLPTSIRCDSTEFTGPMDNEAGSVCTFLNPPTAPENVATRRMQLIADVDTCLAGTRQGRWDPTMDVIRRYEWFSRAPNEAPPSERARVFLMSSPAGGLVLHVKGPLSTTASDSQ
jgi:hypothetical protein